MTTEQMTIHKGLSELKTIDDRINKIIQNSIYIKAVKHSAEKINGMTRDAFKNSMIAEYNKAVDLIARREAIKRAIVLSNAKTTVTIGNSTYTVAEAIEMKNHGMEFKQLLLRYMSSANTKALTELDRFSGENIEKKAEQYVLSFMGAQNKDTKTNSSEVELLRKNYIDNNTYDLIDPLKINEKMEALDDEINNFMTEVDAALSVSNALTTIEINY